MFDTAPAIRGIRTKARSSSVLSFWLSRDLDPGWFMQDKIRMFQVGLPSARLWNSHPGVFSVLTFSGCSPSRVLYHHPLIGP